MMLGIRTEAVIFFYAWLSGCILFIIYQVLIQMRKLIRHSIVMINLEDFLFWMEPMPNTNVNTANPTQIICTLFMCGRAVLFFLWPCFPAFLLFITALTLLCELHVTSLLLFYTSACVFIISGLIFIFK